MHTGTTTTMRTPRTALSTAMIVAGLTFQAPILADSHGGNWEPGGEDIGYQIDGEAFEGYLSSADGDSRGTVLVIHDWDGIDDYERKRADMIAAMGFDAFAVDLYGDGNRPQETGAKKAETERLYKDRERMQALTLGGLEFAREQGVAEKTVIMGYCFGGAVVLEAARNGLVDQALGYATFHGGLGTPEGQSWSAPDAPLLIAHGGADSMISMNDVATLSGELEDVGATYTIEVYSGAPHAFTVFGTGAYQERADKQSWTAFTRLLDEVF
ncbi:dienelactone hydrolase family protein [Guyparkeria halopsychrophila]|uniref:dienelactone hydrolase family protein n=1 Tax=Guyparkeria halopsychrophila TaxID=3139421 RepID=UPI0037C8828D